MRRRSLHPEVHIRRGGAAEVNRKDTASREPILQLQRQLDQFRAPSHNEETT
jgi:hypothetical protein